MSAAAGPGAHRQRVCQQQSSGSESLGAARAQAQSLAGHAWHGRSVLPGVVTCSAQNTMLAARGVGVGEPGWEVHSCCVSKAPAARPCNPAAGPRQRSVAEQGPHASAELMRRGPLGGAADHCSSGLKACPTATELRMTQGPSGGLLMHSLYTHRCLLRHKHSQKMMELTRATPSSSTILATR